MAKKFKYLSVVYGLDVPQGVECRVLLDKEKMIVEVGGTQYQLELSKIRGVDIQKKLDTQIYSKGSLAGGLVGGALFGVAGAVIGSAPKKRTHYSLKRGVVIAYEKGANVTEHIVLTDTLPNVSFSTKLGKELKSKLKKQVKQVRTVEL